jgi:hypothetical protein
MGAPSEASYRDGGGGRPSPHVSASSFNETRSTNQDTPVAAMPPRATAGHGETPGGESGVPADARKASGKSSTIALADQMRGDEEEFSPFKLWTEAQHEGKDATERHALYHHAAFHARMFESIRGDPHKCPICGETIS